jgi:large subunit ribosomal protein L18
MKKRKKRIFGTREKPRLVVYRSLKYIYGQIVDDVQSKVLVSTSNLSKDIPEKVKKAKTKIEASREIGKVLASLAKKKNIERVVFDRNKYIYHGRVKALAEGAREGGLKF